MGAADRTYEPHSGRDSHRGTYWCSRISGLAPYTGRMSRAGLGEAAGSAVVIVSPRHVYQGRPVLVIRDLADLRGPVSGTVTLPLEVFWSGTGDSSRFDLGSPVRLKVMYRTVVREARSPGHLTGYLDGATLVSLWPRLVLPPQVRAAWEEEHPELASMRRGRAAALRAAS